MIRRCRAIVVSVPVDENVRRNDALGIFCRTIAKKKKIYINMELLNNEPKQPTRFTPRNNEIIYTSILPVVSVVNLLLLVLLLLVLVLHIELCHGICGDGGGGSALVLGLSVDHIGHRCDMTRRRNGSDMTGSRPYHSSAVAVAGAAAAAVCSPIVLHAL